MLVMSVMLVSAPMYFIQLHFGMTIYYVLQLLLLGVVALSIASATNRSQFHIQKILACIFLITTLVYFLVVINHEYRQLSSEMLRMLFGYVGKMMVIFLLYYIYSNNYKFVIQYYIHIGLVAVCSSSIVFFLVSSDVWPMGYDYIQINAGKYIYDFHLTFSSSVKTVSGIMIPRMQWFFDEPGAYAFFIVTCILLNDLYTKRRSYNRLLFIGGCISFSFSFYVFTILYILLHYLVPGDKTRAPFQSMRTIFVLLLGGSVTFLLYAVFEPASYMLDHMFSRFEYDSEGGTLKGDNRFYNSIWPVSLMFGDGLVGTRDSVIKEVFNIGVVGLIASYLPLIVCIVRSLWLRQRDVFIACMLTFAMLAQRPVIDKMFLFIFCFIILFRTFDVKKI